MRAGTGTGLGGTQENAQKGNQSGEPGWITADAMQGRILFSDTFGRVCIQGLPCMYVLLSAGSANKAMGGMYMGK